MNKHLEELKDLLSKLAPFLSGLTAILSLSLPHQKSTYIILVIFCFLTAYGYSLRNVYPKMDKITSYMWLFVMFLNLFGLFLR